MIIGILSISFNIWALMRENFSLMFANDKGTDKPAHWPSMISTIVIDFL